MTEALIALMAFSIGVVLGVVAVIFKKGN